MSEEKKEKEKEKKALSTSTNLSTIDHELSEALRVQTQMMLSPLVLEALKTARIFDSFDHMKESLQYMGSINQIMQETQRIVQAFESSNAATRAMLEYQAEISKLGEHFGEINKIVESGIKIPEIAITKLSTELVTIPRQNDTLIRSLLREIDLLEKELAKEKTKNKGLIALLDEKRKELKKQYVT